MQKILHYGLSHNMGGIETYLKKLWTNIDRNKFHFDFIDTTIESPCFYDEFTNLGSKFYKVTPRNVSITKNKKEIDKLFKDHDFDIFHCHLNTLSYVEPIYSALRHGCKVIVHSRNAGASKSFSTNLLHYLHAATLPKKKIKMLAVSDLAGKWLFGSNAQFQTINNGIDIKRFKFSMKIREQVRKRINIDSKFVVGNVGAFLPAKNHRFILSVFGELVKKKPQSVLLLVGEGPLEEEMRNIVQEMGLEEQVLFLGRRHDVPDLLAAMDCFLFPSLFEGFPNAVLEAETSGVPCVISDKITEEVVLLEKCKRLSLDISPEKWAKYILDIGMEENRIYASEIVRQCGFSVEEEVKNIESIYCSLR